ncbi:MAG: hypothetical protein LAT76_07455 [Schleiferiaceae bacterium]|nr:hypothetical protein [Schleiferiaceae bacterium]
MKAVRCSCTRQQRQPGVGAPYNRRAAGATKRSPCGAMRLWRYREDYSGWRAAMRMIDAAHLPK